MVKALVFTRSMREAFLLLASGRDETGYALAVLTSLLAVYGGSYLVVRGVEPKQVTTPQIGALPNLLIILSIMETEIISLSFISGYETFAVLASILTFTILIRHQTNVTDRVLWLGSLILILLLLKQKRELLLLKKKTLSLEG